jgi:hypothetical protein
MAKFGSCMHASAAFIGLLVELLRQYVLNLYIVFSPQSPRCAAWYFKIRRYTLVRCMGPPTRSRWDDADWGPCAPSQKALLAAAPDARTWWRGACSASSWLGTPSTRLARCWRLQQHQGTRPRRGNGCSQGETDRGFTGGSLEAPGPLLAYAP